MNEDARFFPVVSSSMFMENADGKLLVVFPNPVNTNQTSEHYMYRTSEDEPRMKFAVTSGGFRFFSKIYLNEHYWRGDAPEELVFNGECGQLYAWRNKVLPLQIKI